MTNLSDLTKNLKQNTQKLRENESQAIEQMEKDYQKVIAASEKWKKDIEQCLTQNATSISEDISTRNQEIKGELKKLGKKTFTVGALIGLVIGGIFGAVVIFFTIMIMWKQSELNDLENEIEIAQKTLTILDEKTNGVQILTCTHTTEKGEKITDIPCVELEPTLINNYFGKKGQYRAIKQKNRK